jgi:O-antigen ligase
MPLLAGCAALGAAGIWRGIRSGTLHGGLALTLALSVAAVALQLVPFPAPVVETVSPAAGRFLARVDLSYALTAAGAPSAPAVVPPVHPLSLDPTATRVGLTFLIAFASLLLGLAATLTARQARAIADGVLAVGLLLAIVGVVQRAIGGENRVYGFWEPIHVGDPFGPFVNKNHFAGWMLLAIPLCLGRLFERIARAVEALRFPWRDRVLWLATPAASRIFLGGFAVLAMALALVLSMSRSGMTALTIALTLMFVCVLRREPSGSRRLVAGGYLAVLLLVVAGWVGVDAIGHRFTASTGIDLAERTTAWRDALGIVRDFPWTGTGLNTYGTATLVYGSPQLTHHYSAAHSDYLQLAAEGGLLVGIPAVLTLAVFVTVLWRRLNDAHDTFWLRAGAATALAAIALQELVDFSLQIPANAALLAVVAAIAIHRGDSKPANTM